MTLKGNQFWKIKINSNQYQIMNANRKNRLMTNDQKQKFKLQHSDFSNMLSGEESFATNALSTQKYKSTTVSFHPTKKNKVTKSFLNTILGQSFHQHRQNQASHQYIRKLSKLMNHEMLSNSQDPQIQSHHPKNYKQVIIEIIKLIKGCFRVAQAQDQKSSKIYQESGHIIDNQDYQIKAINTEKLVFSKFIKEYQLRLISELKSNAFIKKAKKDLNEFMNKIFYSCESMHSKSFTEIENYILSEWKQNSLLIHLRDSFFLVAEQAFKGNEEYTKVEGKLSFDQFKKFYHKFRNMFGQAVYLIFSGYFKYLVRVKREKTKEWVIDRLINFTSRYMICQCSSWEFISENYLTLYLAQEIQPIKIDIQQSKLPKFEKPVLNKMLAEKDLFKETATTIQKFISKRKLIDKLRYLKAIRMKLEEEIVKCQQQLIDNQSITHLVMFEKDDFITAYLHCIICNEINIEQLQMSVKQIEMMLEDPEDEYMGNTVMTMLSIHECSSYLTDLQAIIDFIRLDLVHR